MTVQDAGIDRQRYIAAGPHYDPVCPVLARDDRTLLELADITSRIAATHAATK